LLVKLYFNELSFYPQKGKSKGKQYNKQLAKKEEKKERRPRTVRDPKTCKQLLGELYADKEYLENFFKEMG
jgi:hypothetical protein